MKGGYSNCLFNLLVKASMLFLSTCCRGCRRGWSNRKRVFYWEEAKLQSSQSSIAHQQGPLRGQYVDETTSPHIHICIYIYIYTSFYLTICIYAYIE